ncbi:MAG: hypothetical protein ACKOX2_10595 [Microcystaceae cyanobacterium]
MIYRPFAVTISQDSTIQGAPAIAEFKQRCIGLTLSLPGFIPV